MGMFILLLMLKEQCFPRRNAGWLLPVRQVLLFPLMIPTCLQRLATGAQPKNGWVGPARTEMRSAEVCRLTLFGVSVHGGRIGASRSRGWPPFDWHIWRDLTFHMTARSFQSVWNLKWPCFTPV